MDILQLSLRLKGFNILTFSFICPATAETPASSSHAGTDCHRTDRVYNTVHTSEDLIAGIPEDYKIHEILCVLNSKTCVNDKSALLLNEDDI